MELTKGPETNAEALAIFAQLAQQNVDVDRLERLMSLYERMVEKKAVERFNGAMAAAQKQMRPVSADAENPQTRSKYASYAKLDAALRPIYTEHGFAVSYDTAKSDKPEHILVLAYVSQENGHTRTYQVEMPNDGKGARGGDVMTKTHATGSAMSYGMRYLLKMIFNVAIGEDDNDGNGAPGAQQRAKTAPASGRSVPASNTKPRKTRADGAVTSAPGAQQRAKTAPASGRSVPASNTKPRKTRADGAVTIVDINVVKGKVPPGKKNAGNPYTLTYIKFGDGKTIGTFDTKIGELAATAKESGAYVQYTTVVNKGKTSLESLELVKEIDEATGFGAELPTESDPQLAQTADREPGDELDDDVDPTGYDCTGGGR